MGSCGSRLQGWFRRAINWRRRNGSARSLKAFSLTPALSRWERENSTPFFESFARTDLRAFSRQPKKLEPPHVGCYISEGFQKLLQFLQGLRAMADFVLFLARKLRERFFGAEREEQRVVTKASPAQQFEADLAFARALK